MKTSVVSTLISFIRGQLAYAARCVGSHTLSVEQQRCAGDLPFICHLHPVSTHVTKPPQRGCGCPGTSPEPFRGRRSSVRLGIGRYPLLRKLGWAGCVTGSVLSLTEAAEFLFCSRTLEAAK